ncbi:hypothetical protein [Aquirhabdus parva]|uniref:Uncharacterized protein n=1 Tax=Aquirhabdus parva TaxID=2283318 RepID=A0A345P5D3_9GAMM|nr:hypothetical protein [Aquirhabdus parva]AXI02492.1 hypothetical protein HYN46_06410 [Aquirhabdus parva]
MATCCDIDGHEEPLNLISLSELFWPQFVYHDGRVYLDHAPEADHYLELLLACEYDKTTVQALCNHRHVLEYFAMFDAKATPTRDELVSFGQRLQAMWQAKLAKDFPDLEIVVAFDVQDDDPDEDLQIVVYEEESVS